MNDPEKTPVNVEDERKWLMGYKDRGGFSWTELGRQTGVATGTLSTFGPGKYAGDNERVAREVFKFRQRLVQQSEIMTEAPEVPEWFDTPTTKRIESVLGWSQRGRMVVIAMGPGCSKTKTIERYKAMISNVWIVTISPSTAGVNNMQIEVLAAMGQPDAVGTPQKLSRRIRERLRGSGGLLIIDEAQHLSEKSLEEVRGWYDAEGVGIALVGNEGVLGRLEGGSRRLAFAQLFSRVSMRLVQALPSIEDGEALADAWGIVDPKEMRFVVGMARKPGGLRGATMAVELATMIARSENNDRALNHLQDAWAQLSSVPAAA